MRISTKMLEAGHKIVVREIGPWLDGRSYLTSKSPIHEVCRRGAVSNWNFIETVTRYVFLLWTHNPIPVRDKTIPAMVSENLSVSSASEG